MFLTMREFKHSLFRFLLIGTIITLMAWLVFLLSGLANGLSTDNASSFQNMKADYLAFQADSRQLLHRSLLPGQAVQGLKELAGVHEAAPIGYATLTVVKAGSNEQLDGAILA